VTLADLFLNVINKNEKLELCFRADVENSLKQVSTKSAFVKA